MDRLERTLASLMLLVVSAVLGAALSYCFARFLDTFGLLAWRLSPDDAKVASLWVYAGAIATLLLYILVHWWCTKDTDETR